MQAESKKNSKTAYIIIAIIAVITAIILIRGVKQASPPAESLTHRPPAVVPSTPEATKMVPEEAKEVSKTFTIEEIRQLQMGELRESAEARGPESRPGKYPTEKELDTLEESGAVLY